MYSRYIPPPKGPKPTATPSSPPAAPRPAQAQSHPPASPPAAPQVVGGAGFSYSRYIPGSRPKPAEKPVETNSVQYFDDEIPPSPPSAKRKRKVVEDGEEPRTSPGPKTKKSKKSKVPEEVNGIDRNDDEALEQTPAVEAKSKKERNGEKGKKDKKSRESETNGHSKGSIPDESKEEGESEKKPKDKKKKPKDAQGSENPQPAGKDEDDADVTMTDGDGAPLPEGATSEPPTKKEKSKKDKKKSKSRAETDDSQGEESSPDAKQRHKLVLERKAKSLQLAVKAAPQDVAEAEPEVEPQEVHDLGPLPQPELVSAETPNPTYETLPPWLAAPMRVPQDKRIPFSDIGLLPKACRVLADKGFPDAFAVQTAAIPLLLPTAKHRPGDLLISAATGSGKTLAYALPIVRDISQGCVTRLRALVVLPTRELAKQAEEVFELCAKAYEGEGRKRVRVGVSIGSQSLKSEQERLIERETRYDPEQYQRLLDETSPLDKMLQVRNPKLGEFDNDINVFSSRVDVLICTPGRLVEHIEQTAGFDLDYVHWLVVDEADKLLAQSFQGWLDVLMAKLKTNKFAARGFADMDLDGVRKVVLSATLTRDLSLLSRLELRRPQLIVLEGDGLAQQQVAEHALPGLLEEFAVRVRNTNLKPLYLLELLKAGHMRTPGVGSQPLASSKDEASSDSDSSDTSSDSSSESSSENSSDSDSEPDEKPPPKTSLPIALIFTKSNESALRLSRLLTILDKSLTPHIATLTSTTPTHIRRKTLRAFTKPSSAVRIIIASDLVARGIDLPNLDHVINYDLPPSVASYVHRVGRTARAGRSGRAWTLVGDDESGWFWGKIAKGDSIRRAQKVARIRIEEMSEQRVKNYEDALEELGREALETRKA
ncbi:ATP-dependent RNA helicase-like protein [Hapsidospora chrysogenum ATCC 11550]|uniref:ATP-dependent RNA helicase n=1 Tax=Hapsidospora chrysogenum (strain ATCC 11550 / CBS 779.69 / DSM 880 / IAM 14645 / JCM 23072 / IMI 49137) TaxID=857340 RepID=A0A086TBL7_HAPC1|nr:ATP-dependent RNA helicase-like protein [Hapsidospora chrysogenum ATCC 11550]